MIIHLTSVASIMRQFDGAEERISYVFVMGGAEYCLKTYYVLGSIYSFIS